MLVRLQGRVYAIDDRCSHRGCPLSDGALEDNVIMCSCHGSRFDIRDGTLLRGPAIIGQPAFETREIDGRIQIRSR